MEKVISVRAAETVSDFVNSLSPDFKGFCEYIGNDHPTLQQSFTALCLEWIKHLSEKPERFIDDRNKAAYKVCNKIKNALSTYEDDIHWVKLPTI